MSKKTIHFVSLGCPKNRVDSEVMLGVAEKAGYSHVSDPEQANVIVVNTCGFIDAAKQESIETILALSQHKDGGSCEKLVVSGSVGRLDAPILHFTYDSLQDCLQKMDRYGEQAALMLHARGVRAGAWQIAARPLWRFFRGYVLRLGFLDGAAGAAMAWARAYEAFRRYARLWELSRLS